MEDYKYFEFWHLAQKLRHQLPDLQDECWAYFDHHGHEVHSLAVGGFTVRQYPGDRKRALLMIKLFIDEYNQRHDLPLTVDEYLK